MWKNVTYFQTSTTAKERQEQMGRPVHWSGHSLEQHLKHAGTTLSAERASGGNPGLSKDRHHPSYSPGVWGSPRCFTPFHQATVEVFFFFREKRVLASKVIPLMKMLNHAVTSKLACDASVEVDRYLPEVNLTGGVPTFFFFHSQFFRPLSKILTPMLLSTWRQQEVRGRTGPQRTFSFLSIITYMGMVKLPSVAD